MSQHAAPSLPQELFDAIIDLIATDWRSLAACALVPSAQTARARLHLSRPIEIRLEYSPIDSLPGSDAHDFMNTFSPGSSLAGLPVKLLICGEGDNYHPSTLPHMLRLDHLRSIQSLKLSRINIRAGGDGGVARFRSLYGSLERLEELHIDCIQIIGSPAQSQPESQVSGYPANSAAQMLAPRGIPSVKVLRIHMHKPSANTPPVDSVISTLRDDILLVDAPPALHTLSLHVHATPGALSGWSGVVRLSRSTLREVRVLVSRPLSADVSFFTALGECDNLESLSLSMVVSVRDESSRTIIPVLTALLSALPTYAFVRTLRALSLALICQPPMGPKLDTSYDPQSLAEFSQVFRPEAYPALRDLQVTPYGGPIDYKGLSLPPHVRSSMVPAKKDLVARISAALGPLRDAGVRISVRRGLQVMMDFVRDSA